MRFYMSLGFRERPDAIALARLAEQVGFDGVCLADHLAMPMDVPTTYPYSNDSKFPVPLQAPWPDVWVLIGALAAATERLRFRTTVYLLPLRHPLIAARAIGTAADLSGGRVELGIGVGWSTTEYEALGLDFHARGAMIDEAIIALKRLWGPGPVTHQGRFWKFGPIYAEPVPAHPIPILVGGTSAAAMRRAARCDGFIAPPLPYDETITLIGTILALRHEINPERTPFAIHAHPIGPMTPERYRDVAAAGAEAVSVSPWTADMPIGEKPAALRRFAEEVLEPLKSQASA